MNVLEVSKGRFRARTRYRDSDGIVRQPAAFGKTKDAARRALGKKLADRPHRPTGALQTDSLFGEVCEAWYERVSAENRLAPTSLIKYRQTLDSPILPQLGHKPFSAVDATLLDAFLMEDAQAHPARAKRAKNVLSQVMLHAIRHKLIAGNPVRDVGRLPAAEPTDPRPATVAEVRRLRETATAFEAGILRAGRRPTTPIGAIIDVMLCGLRPGEAIALRWEDLELEAAIPRIAITGTVIQVPKTFDGGPTARRQDKTKTPRSRRTIDLPDEVAARLRALPKRGTLVFCTASGSPYSPKNVARAWRTICEEAKVDGLVMHGLRKTAATVTNAASGSQAAADLLGHTSDELTKRTYIGREASVSWGRDALAPLFKGGE